MFWCQSRTLYEVHRPAMGGDGWECAECGAFYIDNEQHLKNLLFDKENYGYQEEDR